MNNYELTDDLLRRLVNPSNHGEAGKTDLHEMVEFIISCSIRKLDNRNRLPQKSKSNAAIIFPEILYSSFN